MRGCGTSTSLRGPLDVCHFGVTGTRLHEEPGASEPPVCPPTPQLHSGDHELPPPQAPAPAVLSRFRSQTQQGPRVGWTVLAQPAKP